jgi:hypothetical protein
MSKTEWAQALVAFSNRKDYEMRKLTNISCTASRKKYRVGMSVVFHAHVTKLVTVFAGIAMTVLVLLCAGCSTPSHTQETLTGTKRVALVFSADYEIASTTRIEVGPVINQTKEQSIGELQTMLADALRERLSQEGLLAISQDASNLLISSKITEYQKGNAFVRFLVGRLAGKTVLNVQFDCRIGDKVVGAGEARREVLYGGQWTIGAWKSVFKSLAKDIAQDIKQQIKATEKRKKQKG